MTKIASKILKKEKLQDPIVSENAAKVLHERYLARDDYGNVIEDPKDMYIRVAEAIASAELTLDDQIYWAHKFYNLMAENKFMPNSPTLMNAGRRLGLLSACLVLPVEDDLEQIFESVKTVALCQRSGAGTGFNFSNLRPSGAIVKSSGGTTAGPLSFIDVFSQATNTIQQGAFRRGANMGQLDCSHPDIVDFIHAKTDLSRWQNYNVSVVVTDAFMEELIDSPSNIHKVHHKEWGTGALYINTKTNKVKAIRSSDSIGENYKPWTVSDTWNLICKRAWETGEPGLLFVDEVNRNNPIISLGKINATNPCGEIPLHPWDVCNLGSINLSKYVVYNKIGHKDTEESASFDFEKFYTDIGTCVRFLDNVIDVNKYPVKQISDMSKKTRRIGLGIMGFADMLFMIGIAYNSDAGRIIASKISAALDEAAYTASSNLALDRGNFGAWSQSSYAKTNTPMRNSFRCTIAPTGTISIIANCSGGIEPLFALAFKRTVMPDANGIFKEMNEINPYFLKAAEEYDKSAIEIALKTGSLHDYNGNNYLKSIFVTSHDISPLDHVKMQAAWQKYIDNSISKTINLPNDAPIDVVNEVYKLAFKMKCKGITVYRDGCRNNVAGMKQPMSVEKESTSAKEATILEKEAPTSMGVSDIYPAYRTQVKTQFGNLHVCVVLDSTGQKEMEIFAQLGKAGDIIAADIEAICRLASLALKNGATIEQVIDQLIDIGTTHIMPSQDGKIVSMPDALAKGLKKYLQGKQHVTVSVLSDSKQSIFTTSKKSKGKDITESKYGVKCPACPSGKIVFQEGCQKCFGCGYTAC
jgi:ribonucleoside-diphosphate reductase alpha chain